MNEPKPIMIHRNCKEGLKLDVVGLNEITVLIDRAETELTEVAINIWHRDLDGPPHSHTQKEQVFLVTSGRGRIRLGDREYPAEPGSLFYVPAGLVHQSLTHGAEPLEYFLFNAFLNSDKEGHASFADHIEKVKETRRQQALTQRAAAVSAEPTTAGTRPGKALSPQPAPSGFSVVARVDRAETQRCEVVALALPPDHATFSLSDATKEQTVLVSVGSGTVTVNGEVASLGAGEIVFVPRGARATLQAGPDGMQAVSFGTVITD